MFCRVLDADMSSIVGRFFPTAKAESEALGPGRSEEQASEYRVLHLK